MTSPAELLKNLEYRLVGPFRGGRVGAVAGDPFESQVFYFGSTGGGVWKTSDGGIYWRNISDGFFQRASVGAIAVATADPNVIYVGMGESCIRGNVSHGDGVYKSTDAGKTWMHLGLEDTRHIAKVRVHPTDPNTLYVAALGHAHGPNQQRGVFRSRDGGTNWEHVLFRSQDAGASDLSMDPHNPRVLFASFWETRRGPNYLNSGGPGSGLFRSTDAGDTWTEISRNKGLPKGVLGKIGVCVSGAQRDRVYAIFEAEDGAVFRSDDAGETWDKVSTQQELRQRAWYYHHIIADPRDPNTVWVMNIETWRSVDGGQTFSGFATPHGDNHDLWIDPNNPQRMIQGNDGGALITFNGGASWSSIYNQPTAELYHVTTDTRVPYRLHGAQQDNTTISVPSRSPLIAITNNEYWDIGGGESGYVAVRPDKPNIIFAGSYLGFLTRYDHETGQARNVEVWPEELIGSGAKDAKYRFQWTFPILLSPHDPNVLYATGNVAFRSTDEGTTWQPISPDLTRNDPSKFDASGGPITKDNTGAEYYGTIFAFAESPLQRGVFWAGSDDGLIHVSRDNGASWQNVTPPGLPEWALISIIEASPHDAATAYVAANRYKLDDFAPYLFKTSDFGSTWTRITSGLPDDVFCRTIREDPTRRGLLYAGTETGVYFSVDDGGAWQPLKGNLPVVPIHDLVVKEPEGDLVLATHGRSFWVLDGLGPVRALHDDAATVLVQPRPAVRYLANGGFGHRAVRGNNYRMPGAVMVTYTQKEDPRTGDKIDVYVDSARNPPDGAIIDYFLSSKPSEDITLTFLEADGREIRSFSSKDVEAAATTDEEKAEVRKNKQPRIPKEEGLNRWVWNLRYADATKLENDDIANELIEDSLSGPRVPPGTYTVRLAVGDQTYEQSFEVQRDPRIEATDADLRAQFDLMMQVHQKLSETHSAINRLRAVRRQAEDWLTRSRGKSDLDAVNKAAQAVVDRVKPIEAELIQVNARTRGDTLNFPVRLNGKLAALKGTIASADSAPTAGARSVFDDLSGRVQTQLDQLSEVLATEVAFLNQSIQNANVPVVGL
ncbi:MAG: glycosyl hydrolase [Chloroflexi bacterium]|nr:glycosyl hydrolase [Chloroflexota bacterium]